MCMRIMHRCNSWLKWSVYTEYQTLFWGTYAGQWTAVSMVWLTLLNALPTYSTCWCTDRQRFFHKVTRHNRMGNADVRAVSPTCQTNVSLLYNYYFTCLKSRYCKVWRELMHLSVQRPQPHKPNPHKEKREREHSRRQKYKEQFTPTQVIKPVSATPSNTLSLK